LLEEMPMTRTITAVYDKEAEALRACEQLVGSGVSTNDVRIVSQTLSRSDVDAAEKSIWESLADFLIVDADRALYDESLRRGGYLVTARVEDEVSDQVISILDRTNPIDLEERSRQWQDEGWAPEGLGAPASMHGYAPGAGPTTESVSQELRAQVQQLDADARKEAMEQNLTPEAASSSRRVRSYLHDSRPRQ
jgi:hypothetical protein